MILKSRRLYKKHKYFTRKKLNFPSHESKHVKKAKRMYGVEHVSPETLAPKTGCSVASLKEIVRKGEGAYYSSGSRPNQTARSWGVARLASAITGGKASAVDFHIIEKGCSHTKKAFKLARKNLKKHKYGRAKTVRVSI
jgi:hypothetical protein